MIQLWCPYCQAHWLRDRAPGRLPSTCPAHRADRIRDEERARQQRRRDHRERMERQRQRRAAERIELERRAEIADRMLPGVPGEGGRRFDVPPVGGQSVALLGARDDEQMVVTVLGRVRVSTVPTRRYAPPATLRLVRVQVAGEPRPRDIAVERFPEVRGLTGLDGSVRVGA